MLIPNNLFSGGASLHDGDLAAALRGIAQTFAARTASGVADLTADNSGGTPGATIADVPNFTLSAVSGTNAVAKTEMETAFGLVVDGIAEIVAQADTIRDSIPNVFGALTDSMGGTAADGTIGALDVSATGVNAAMASAAGSNTVLAAVRSRLAQAAMYVNALCVATGQTPLTNGLVSNLAADAAWGTTFAAVSTDTGTATDGSDTTAANAIVLKTEFDARMATMADAIASMAAKLDAITDDANATAVCGVIAAA